MARYELETPPFPACLPRQGLLEECNSLLARAMAMMRRVSAGCTPVRGLWIGWEERWRQERVKKIAKAISDDTHESLRSRDNQEAQPKVAKDGSRRR